MEEVHENQSTEGWNKSKKYKAYQHDITIIILCDF